MKVKDSALQDPDTATCPLCRGPNDCQLCTNAAYKGPCWCAGVDIPQALLDQAPSDLKDKACICQGCVMKFHRLKKDSAPEKLLPGDFYLEKNGALVFTADYHLRRGSCCGSGCRHCPYGK
jgi:hypothetical protein